jgi:putative zinc- or iron-chelating protein
MAVPLSIKAGDKPSGSPTTLLRQFMRGQAAGRVNVPCGSCNACCRSPRLPAGVLAHEAANLPPGSVIEGGDDGLQLARREDGACILLDEKGRCTIYDRRPRSCRIYDCRIPNLLVGWVDITDDIMLEAISQWAPLRMATVDDVDMFTAIRLALADGGLPGTYRHAIDKVMRWQRYLDRARQHRELNPLLGKVVTVNGTRGVVVAITMAGNLIVDLRRSGGRIVEIKVLMKKSAA